MPVLVTGAAGLVGRAVVDELVGDGMEVIAQDRDLSAFSIAADLRLVEGDMCETDVRREALVDADSVVHLAAVMGQQSESNWALSRAVNLDLPIDILGDLARRERPARLIFASSIAVLGADLPPGGVNEDTPSAPHFLYGAQKAMIETLIETLSVQRRIDGISLRFPGILPRRRTHAALDAGFMSNIFHALAAGETYMSPVSAEATIWVQSVNRLAKNVAHALRMDTAGLTRRTVTLPAVRVSMAELAKAIVVRSDSSGSIAYHTDEKLEQAFGRFPELCTPIAEQAGFAHDGSLDALVANVLAALGESDAV